MFFLINKQLISKLSKKMNSNIKIEDITLNSSYIEIEVFFDSPQKIDNIKRELKKIGLDSCCYTYLVGKQDYTLIKNIEGINNENK